MGGIIWYRGNDQCPLNFSARTVRGQGTYTLARAPRVSMHDFDALTQMRLLQKIGKLKEVTIIGVPPEMNEQKTFESISALLEKII